MGSVSLYRDILLHIVYTYTRVSIHPHTHFKTNIQPNKQARIHTHRYMYYTSRICMCILHRTQIKADAQRFPYTNIPSESEPPARRRGGECKATISGCCTALPLRPIPGKKGGGSTCGGAPLHWSRARRSSAASAARSATRALAAVIVETEMFCTRRGLQSWFL